LHERAQSAYEFEDFVRGQQGVSPPVARGQPGSGKSRPEPLRLPADIAFLAGQGFPAHLLAQAAQIGEAKGIAASEVLMARGWLDRKTYGQQLAAEAGLEHCEEIPAGFAAADAGHAVDAVESGPLLALADDGPVLCVAAGRDFARDIAAVMRGKPGLLSRIRLVPGPELRIARLAAKAEAQSRRAAFSLSEKTPHFSALRRLSPAQRLFFVLMAAACLAGMVLWPAATLTAAGMALTAFYTAAVLLRAIMIWRLDKVRRPLHFRPKPAAPEDLPRYSILVALYREAGQVRPLVEALSALQWPADRREVFLVCEADDAATVTAVWQTELPEGFHLVLCPPSLPRTKPKALNYALPLASGRYTVIYDAEDRPHPLQLREAHERFEQAGPQLACLQAPLAIHNGGENWLTAMFSVEYDTLFRGMLPVLEGFGGPLPLGGTSNHFRTDALRSAGEWDPWNVTEDADLGVRLARLGHQCGTLNLPTQEEAPPDAGIWLRQRTRWLKGWMQTILVHSRNPAGMIRQIGWRRTALFHLVLTSIVVSALAHPLFLAVLCVEALQMASGAPAGLPDRLLFGLAFFNLAAGYTTYAFFAREVVLRNRGRKVGLLLLTLPAYWLMISAAGWRAAWQFIADPFRWEKTEHGLSKSAGGANMNVKKATGS
jgi:cellulose synthase/poly-beta-1,6-N-acetylglucosamine synthase-like glycosyltransferase